MRIVVAVKYVPGLQSDRRFDEAARTVRGGVEDGLNELDEHAVEAALRVVEALPEDERAGSEVVALTVGPAGADVALRRTFQLGADRAIRITDDVLAGSDFFGTAVALAGGVRRLAEEAPIDLVITGMAALDGMGSVVPSLLAAELDWPQLTLAAELTVEGGTATVTRDLDEAREVLTAPLPAVVSVTDVANAPRMPGMKLMLAARTKKTEAWSAADAGVDPGMAGTAGARVRVVEARPHPARPEVELVVDDGQGGTALAEFLIRNDLV